MAKPYFHKLILSNSVKDKKLRIPDNFVKQFGHDLSAFGKISVPGGPVLPLGLIKADDKFWFHDGWLEFMERYSIRVGYFLVFKYEGHAVFTVHIFNLSTSEINYESNTLSGSPSLAFEEMEDEDMIDSLSSSTCFVPIFLKRNIKSSKCADISHAADDEATRGAEVQLNPIKQKHAAGDMKFYSPVEETQQKPKKRERKILKIDTCKSIEETQQKPKNRGRKKLRIDTCKSIEETQQKAKKRGRKKLKIDTCESIEETQRKPQKRGKKKVKIDTCKSIEETQQKPKKRGRKKLKIDNYTQQTLRQEDDFRFYECASVRKRTLTDEQRERAIAAAKTFESVNPFIWVVLKPSYLYKSCIMYLPSCFAEKNLNGVCGFIKLRVGNRQWPVKCRYRGGIAKLSQGWYKFTLENNLGEGDVCIFELMKSRNVVLKVTVFRVPEGAARLN